MKALLVAADAPAEGSQPVPGIDLHVPAPTAMMGARVATKAGRTRSVSAFTGAALLRVLLAAAGGGASGQPSGLGNPASVRKAS